MGDQYDEQARDLMAYRFRCSSDQKRAEQAVARALRAAADGARREAVWRENLQAHIAAMRMVREWVEQRWVGALPAEEQTMPEPAFEAEAIIAALEKHAGTKIPSACAHRWGAVACSGDLICMFCGATPSSPDPVAAAREAVWRAAMARWRSEASREPAYWDKPSAETIAMNEACAALDTLEKGEG